MFTDDHIYTTQFDLTLYDGSAYDSKKRPDIFEYHTSKDNDVITWNLYFGIAQYWLAAKYYHTSLQQFNDLDSKAAQEINTIYTISMQKYIQKLILLSQDEIILKKDIYIRGLIDMATENKQIYTFIISLERDISFFDEYPEWQALKDSYK